MDAGQNSWDRANQLLRTTLTALGLIAIRACLGLGWRAFSDREWHQFAIFACSTGLTSSTRTGLLFEAYICCGLLMDT